MTTQDKVLFWGMVVFALVVILTSIGGREWSKIVAAMAMLVMLFVVWPDDPESRI